MRVGEGSRIPSQGVTARHGGGCLVKLNIERDGDIRVLTAMEALREWFRLQMGICSSF